MIKISAEPSEIERQLSNFIGGSADISTSTKACLSNNINETVKQINRWKRRVGGW